MRRIDTFTMDYLKGSRTEGLFNGDTQAVCHFINAQDGQTVVDFGTGLGYLISLIEPAVNGCRFIGVDLQKDLIKEAKRTVRPKNRSNRVEFILADARATGLESELTDLAMCCALLVHPSSPEKTVSEMIRVTKLGGRIVTVEPVPCNLAPELYYDVDPRRKIAELARQSQLVNETAEPNADYDIALRMPHLFEQRGLAGIEVEILSVFRRYGQGFEKCRILLWVLAKGTKPQVSGGEV